MNPDGGTNTAHYIVDGSVYGVPYMYGPNFLMYNTEEVELPSQTRSAPFPLRVRPGAAAASMVTSLDSTSGPEVRVMVWPASAGAKRDGAARGQPGQELAQRSGAAVGGRGHGHVPGGLQLHAGQPHLARRACRPRAARSRSPTPAPARSRRWARGAAGGALRGKRRTAP